MIDIQLVSQFPRVSSANENIWLLRSCRIHRLTSHLVPSRTLITTRQKWNWILQIRQHTKTKAYSDDTLGLEWLQFQITFLCRFRDYSEDYKDFLRFDLILYTSVSHLERVLMKGEQKLASESVNASVYFCKMYQKISLSFLLWSPRTFSHNITSLRRWVKLTQNRLSIVSVFIYRFRGLFTLLRFRSRMC